MKISPPYDRPLKFSPILKEKIWGGGGLSRYLSASDGYSAIGEAWLLSGYGSDISELSNPVGSLRTLSNLLDHDSLSLQGPLGDSRLFPLLYKFIDASDNLSVQVHPDDRSAVANRWGKLGKTECWYVMDAAPNSELILGFRERFTMGDISEAVKCNRLDELLNRVPVKSGDVLFIPAGTVHAILKGITIYEVQESSDTTFRLYDWGRTDDLGHSRHLHIAESLSVLDTDSPGGKPIKPISLQYGEGAERLFRCACRFFSLEEFCLIAGKEIILPKRTSFSVITAIEGSADIGNGSDIIHLGFGETILIPAAINNGIRLVSGDCGSRILVSGVPDLSKELIFPLRAAGVSASSISALGGINPLRNDLLKLL